MTDKEQIMIDGVDVRGCINFNKKDNISCNHPYFDKCREVPNCCFKQLARKTQECEQKEKELNELKRQYKLSCLDCEYKNTKADVDRYRKALEEIEEECNYAPMCDTEFSQRVLDIINKVKGEGND